MWGQPPRLSAERSDARMERTLLSVAFDFDLDFDFVPRLQPRIPREPRERLQPRAFL
jgi:hypothetical protein